MYIKKQVEKVIIFFLFQVFRNDELRQLLKLLRDSSLAVLDQNKDTLGYDLD